MSFDLVVWSATAVGNDKDAAELYRRLCDAPEDAYKGLPESSRVHAFYAELTERHPEIDDVPEDRIDDTDFCPWSIAFDRSDRHILMCAVWAKATYVEETVRTLASKHGLAVFNPQSEKLYVPGKPTTSNDRPWWYFW